MAHLLSFQIARHFNRQHSTIQQLWAKFRRTGSVADIRRRPKGRITTRRQDRYIIVSHLRDRFTPATRTARVTIGTHNRHIHAQTVRNRLRAVGLRARRPRKGPILTRDHRRARLAWARRHFRFTRADWSNVIFVDESRFTLRGADGRVRAYRRRGERNSANCVVQVDKYGGGSLLVWAGVSMHTRTPIVPIRGNLNARKYQNDILQPVLVPHVNGNRGMILAQDNAPCHVARNTRAMLAANNVQTLPWPAKSPDLNPIEHVWDLLKRKVRAQPQQLNMRELERDIMQAWATIPQRYLQRYIVSMRARCRAVIAAEGGHTKY